MTAPSTRRVRLAAGAGLVLVMVASLGLGWGVRLRNLRSQRQNPGASTLEDMEAAHAAAGVETATLAAVQSGFYQRVESLRSKVAENPNDPALALELAHFLHDGHQAAEAATYYEAAIDLDPDDGQPYYDLALAYTDQGAWEAAAGVLQRRLDIAPDDPVAQYDLGAVFANLGDREGARAMWTAVLASGADADLRQRTERAMAQLGGLDPP